MIFQIIHSMKLLSITKFRNGRDAYLRPCGGGDGVFKFPLNIRVLIFCGIWKFNDLRRCFNFKTSSNILSKKNNILYIVYFSQDKKFTYQSFDYLYVFDISQMKLLVDTNLIRCIDIVTN